MFINVNRPRSAFKNLIGVITMICLYGANLSSPANKVRFALNLLGLEYEYKQVNLRAGEHKTEEYLKIHPAGKVPALTDGDFCLFESNAMIRYLADKCDSELYPKDLKKRATVEQWLDYCSIHLGMSMARVTFNRVFAPAFGMPVDESSLKTGIEFLARDLPVIDKQLGKTKYMAGNDMTLADISLLSCLDPAEVSDVDLTPYKNICAWRNELCKQEFYSKCHQSYKDVVAAVLKG
jgi:glutathione S-transferase